MKLIRYICVLVVVATAKVCFCQDVIFYTNGKTDTVQLIEINSDFIIYQKKLEGGDSNRYSIERHKVNKIILANGIVETFADLPINPHVLTFKPNIFAANLFGFFVGNIHINYERIGKRGKFGIRTHLYISTDLVGDWGMMGTGFDFNFYPRGQGELKYYLGPAIRFGFLNYMSDRYFRVLLFNNGVSTWINKSTYAGCQVGAGGGFFEETFFPYGYISFNLGKRF